MRITLLCLALLVGCSRSSDRCTDLRDHLIDTRLQGISGVDIAAHRAAMSQALGDDFVARCETTIAATERRCMLAADNSAAIDACRRR
jgi:hypothetical protein